MTHSTLEAIFSRRSIRRFTSESLTANEIEVLRQVALASPTGMDVQPWQFHFLLNPDKINMISHAALATLRASGNQATVDRMAKRHESLFYGAPLVVFISMPVENMSGVDAGIAAQSLALAAQSMGLGSCIIGLAAAAFEGEQTDEVKASLHMSGDRAFIISVAIGHPDITKDAHIRHEEKAILIT